MKNLRTKRYRGCRTDRIGFQLRAANKSLQLSPKTTTDYVDLRYSNRKCCVDAAGQLSSMLGFQNLLKEPIDVTD